MGRGLRTHRGLPCARRPLYRIADAGGDGAADVVRGGGVTVWTSTTPRFARALDELAAAGPGKRLFAVAGLQRGRSWTEGACRCLQARRPTPVHAIYNAGEGTL